MIKRKLAGAMSVSATKRQKNAARLMFGTKSESILAALEAIAKESSFVTDAHLDHILAFLNKADEDTIARVASSAPGKRMVAAARRLANAKTLVTVLNALKDLKSTRAVRTMSGIGPAVPETVTAEDTFVPDTKPTPPKDENAKPEVRTYEALFHVVSGGIPSANAKFLGLPKGISVVPMDVAADGTPASTAQSNSVLAFDRKSKYAVTIMPREVAEIAGIATRAAMKYVCVAWQMEGNTDLANASRRAIVKAGAFPAVFAAFLDAVNAPVRLQKTKSPRVYKRKPRVAMPSIARLASAVTVAHEDGEAAPFLLRLSGRRVTPEFARARAGVLLGNEPTPVYFQASLKSGVVFLGETKTLPINLRSQGRYTVGYAIVTKDRPLAATPRTQVVFMDSGKTFQEALQVFLGSVANPVTIKDLKSML